ARSLKALLMPGGERVAVGIPSAIRPEMREGLAQELGTLSGVDHVAHVSRPYKLVSREFHRADTTINVRGVLFGGSRLQIMAGPCAVESYEQMFEAAKAVKQTGATVLRGGAFKPRTSPYSFQGMQEEGLKILKQVGSETGLLTISEVMQPDLVELVGSYVD